MNDGLLDIRPPPLPSEGIGVTVLLVALLLLSALVLLLRHYRSPRNRARRQLGRLRSATRHGYLDNRAAAHALAGLLRQGLGTHRQRGMFTPDMDAAWSDFSRRLAEARFAPQPCSPEQLRALLEEAGALLEQRS